MRNTGLSALGKLAALGVLMAAFLSGMAGVVYMALKGEEVSVPEITGKEFSNSERVLASLGLKIKKRADRFSPEAPNTIIEQLPKPGETVKTGQMILVVVSKGPGEGDERPPSLKDTEQDDTEKIEEMISDKPKKPKASSNSNRKKADTARDVNVNSATSTDAKTDTASSGKKEPAAQTAPAERPATQPTKAANTGTKPSGTPNPRPSP
jgi:beta-lactam-binding protein with PASTA domain